MGQYSDADSSLEGNVPEADVVQESAADANDQLWCSGGVPATIKSHRTQSFSKRPRPPPILSRCTFDHKQQEPDGDKMVRGIDLVWAGITEKLINKPESELNWL